jgi:hypothetical protein
MSAKRILAATMFSVALAAAHGSAAADDVAVGVVVKVDTREIYVNLGGGKGVVDGAALRLKRPVTLRHPVTRAPVKDWLPIGNATVTSAGDKLAMAVLDPELRAQVAVGDIAEIYVERDEAAPPPPPPPKTPAPDDTSPIPQIDGDTAAVLAVWRSVSGQSLDRRINAWEGWLSANPQSPHAAAIRDDLTALRSQREAASPRRPTPGRATVQLGHQGPTRGEAGRDLPLVFVVDNPAAVVSASLHYRAAGETTYQRVLLRREGDLYLRGSIPGAAVNAPGVEYFVEAAVPHGESGAAFASPTLPSHVEVAPPPAVLEKFAGTRHRTRLTIMASYMDFANLDDRPTPEGGSRTDRIGMGEIDVLYRIGGVIYGVRAGFGSYGGVGGYANVVYTDASPAPRRGFQYGYAEIELAPPMKKGPPVGLAGRFYAGVGEEGLALGGAARLRLGSPDGANLSLGVQGVEEIGFVSDMRLETRPDQRIPVGISVGVTDQPGNGDLGARLAVDVGWRALSWIQPTLRLSWQGRTAVHSGVGGGLGVVFDW